MKSRNLFTNFMLYIQTFLLAPLFFRLRIWQISNSFELDKNRYETLSQEDIKVVMDRLGISYELNSTEMGSQSLGDDYLSETFEELEPCLEEVKEAFDVFDENKDGFIDAMELQRVLRSLCVKEKLVQVEECTRMITVADENNDGRIDFNEFLKFMETCF